MSADDEFVSPAPAARLSGLGAALRRYVTRNLAAPTAVALLGLGAAYLTRSLLQWSDLLVNRGLGADAVAVLALHEFVPVLTQVLPFATLIGVLSGLGHLRSTGELVTVETCGVSPRRLVRPAVSFAAALTALALALSLWLAPASRAHRTEALLAMLAEQPGATLTAGPVHEFGDHRLTAREVSSRGDALRGVVLWSPELGETLFAERANLQSDHEGGIELELQQATALLGPAQGGGQIEVDTFRAVLAVTPRGLGGEEGALTAVTPGELLRRSREAEASGARLARAELHRRLALPLAGVLLALVAVPLALSGSGSSRTSGAMRGMILTVAYYGLIQVGNGLLRDPDVPVELAIWLPNFLVIALAAGLFLRPTTTAGARGNGGGRTWLQSPALPWAPMGRYILARYVATVFVQMAFVCIIALFVGYLLVDVLERLQWFARYEATAVEAARFYGARAPLLLCRVAPMGLLAAAALTISQLDRRGELVAMQACGVSALRSLAPISAVALIVAPIYFFVSDAVVPRTNSLADHLKNTEIKGDLPEKESSRFVWHRVGVNLLQADRMDEDRGVATDVTIYELDERGFPQARIDAEEAHKLGEGEWALTGARRVAISGLGVSRTDAPTRIKMGGDPADLDPMHLDVRALAREIGRARADGYGTTAYEVDLQARLAAPFACILLPWIAIAGALTGPKGRSASRSLVLAAILAVGFELFGDVSVSLAYGERISPMVAVWGPIGVLGLLVVGLARRSPR